MYKKKSYFVSLGAAPISYRANTGHRRKRESRYTLGEGAETAHKIYRTLLSMRPYVFPV